jgi:Ca-activated chloride channel family protein
VITTRLNTPLLRELAKKTNGVFAQLEYNYAAIKMIASRLDGIQKNTFDEKIFVEYESRFQYFLLPALLLLIAEIFIGNRRRKIKPKMNKTAA